MDALQYIKNRPKSDNRCNSKDSL